MNLWANNNKNNDKICYYPSLSAYQLKRVSIFEWNGDKNMIDQSKKWPNRTTINGPIMDNLFVVCYPNVVHPIHAGKFNFLCVVWYFQMVLV